MSTRSDCSAGYRGKTVSIQQFFNQIEQCELPVHSLIVCHHGSTIAEFVINVSFQLSNYTAIGYRTSI
ncbi:hypothetical protein [Paenibacillus alvei]|uniref:hypothetical protein n=1 Tax=Paenibacillus alvei TaxID=44250 RepID=UPI0010FF3219|nr:hypothetical protein [Paenibacillus alvei]